MGLYKTVQSHCSFLLGHSVWELSFSISRGRNGGIVDEIVCRDCRD